MSRFVVVVRCRMFLLLSIVIDHFESTRSYHSLYIST